MDEVLAVIMAGGMGARLQPLTSVRAKPAVPFGGIYRLIDFTLSNCLNSGLRRIWVLTQYKSHSLSRHLNHGWGFLPMRLDQFIGEIPAQMQEGSHWYKGTADALRQNMHIFERSNPHQIMVLSGDHVYKMDYRLLKRFHDQVGACLTVSTIRVPVDVARGAYGVLEVDEDWRIVGFEEKPDEPKAIPGTDECLASMGVYLFQWDTLCQELGDHQDFGHEVIPAMLARGKAIYAWDHTQRNVIAESEYQERTGYRQRELVQRSSDSAYWRDVGTLQAYWAANIDLVSIAPRFNLYGERWPIYNFPMHFPPTKFVHEAPGRTGVAYNSILADGVIVSGATIRSSLVGPATYVHSYSYIENSVVMGGSYIQKRLYESIIGRGCHIRNAILDKRVHINEGTRLGWDRAEDEARGLTTESIPGTDDYVVVVPKGAVL